MQHFTGVRQRMSMELVNILPVCHLWMVSCQSLVKQEPLHDKGFLSNSCIFCRRRFVLTNRDRRRREAVSVPSFHLVRDVGDTNDVRNTRSRSNRCVAGCLGVAWALLRSSSSMACGGQQLAALPPPTAQGLVCHVGECSRPDSYAVRQRCLCHQAAAIF